ncbi:hypothetical protein CPB83DRAFT_900696 [Crepidotus variabilis]|uniref:Uncharacterized protein n=1 Tax=Crepidotus variabilis TaxID=179855 RepID=A0A9P6BCB4_9AGAR|nr:hypothetical protein CPB83DRAFT_900696 [Crepidotus variabilis]
MEEVYGKEEKEEILGERDVDKCRYDSVHNEWHICGLWGTRQQSLAEAGSPTNWETEFEGDLRDPPVPAKAAPVSTTEVMGRVYLSSPLTYFAVPLSETRGADIRNPPASLDELEFAIISTLSLSLATLL